MENQTTSWTLGELANILGAELEGPADLFIRLACPCEAGEPNGLAFAETEDFLASAEASGVGAVLVSKEMRGSDRPLLRAKNPRATFGHFLTLCKRPLPLNPGIHPLASVSPNATVAPDAQIGPFAVVEAKAVIESRAKVYSFAYVGENCRVGAGSTLFPHAVLYQDVTLGENCIIHAGAVLGADGFGFIWDGSKRVKVPQVGRTILENDVEIGASSAVDRAMMGETRVEEGTKIDNLVQIGHNSVIGRHTVVAGLVGISGSTTIGARCILAGQVALKDHVTVADDVTLIGRAGVTKDIKEAGVYYGFPAAPVKEQLRYEAELRRVPKLADRVKELEKRLAELESRA